MVTVENDAVDVGKEKRRIRAIFTVASAADAFARNCYQVDLLAATRWKLELIFRPELAHWTLSLAWPRMELEYQPSRLADELTAAAAARFGDGVIPRGGGDMAIRTSHVKTISEFRTFLHNFAEGYLKALEAERSPGSLLWEWSNMGK